MTAVETDIEVVQSATFTMAVTWTDNATPPNPNSLAGYRAHMQMRPHQRITGTILIDLASTGSNPSITLEPDGQTGVVRVRISALDTATLRKNCYYDLFLINDADATDAVRLIFGQVVLDKSVTINPVITVAPTNGDIVNSDSGGTLTITSTDTLTVTSDNAGTLTLTSSGDIVTSDGTGTLTIEG